MPLFTTPLHYQNIIKYLFQLNLQRFTQQVTLFRTSVYNRTHTSCSHSLLGVKMNKVDPKQTQLIAKQLSAMLQQGQSPDQMKLKLFNLLLDKYQVPHNHPLRTSDHFKQPVNDVENALQKLGFTKLTKSQLH